MASKSITRFTPAKATTPRKAELSLRSSLPARRFPACTLLALLCFAGLAPAGLGPGPAEAQEPPPDRYPLRVDVRLVNVDVAVTDAEGNFVPGLQPENFRVLEDGVEQEVVHFAPTRAPVRIALLVEASPAVFLIRRDHLAAAYHLLAGLRPVDQAALLTYDREAHRQVDFTRNKQRIQQRLARLQSFGLGMAKMNLLDAVAQTLTWLSPPPRRTAVLVIGTGLDTGSRVNGDTLERRVGAGQLTFFAVATGHLLRDEPDKQAKREASTSEDAYFQQAFARADARLRALAAASAGQTYFPGSYDELPGIYREIAERLRNLYSLGYYPTKQAREGSYREISVELVNEKGEPLVLRGDDGRPLDYRVFARPGYFAPRE